MESKSTQTNEIFNEKDNHTIKSKPSIQYPGNTIPLVVTIIGVFCYLGVILPSVFETNATLIDYSSFDIPLMVGGAALVGLGSYLWFKVKNKNALEDENKKIEYA